MIINKSHQYQQNEQSSFGSNYWTQYMAFEIQVLAWDRYKHVAGLNQLMRSQPSPSPSDNWNSNNNTEID